MYPSNTNNNTNTMLQLARGRSNLKTISSEVLKIGMINCIIKE
jgi:hypothetical protein